MKKQKIYIMETNDIDDYMTLSMLASHPSVSLLGVCVVPGTPEQVGIIKTILNEAKCTARIGTMKGKNGKPTSSKDAAISPVHYKFIPRFQPCYNNESSDAMLYDIIKSNPDVTVITGSWLTPLAEVFKNHTDLTVNEVVLQGGYAGSNLVKKEDTLEKFHNQETVRTFNFNQDVNSADYVLNCDRIKTKYMVSKNVCHGNIYSDEVHEIVKQNIGNYVGLRRIYDGMCIYYSSKPHKKAFHDPLAAAVAIDKLVCQFVEVEPYHEGAGIQSKWGSKPKTGTNKFISVKADYNKFVDILIAK